MRAVYKPRHDLICPRFRSGGGTLVNLGLEKLASILENRKHSFSGKRCETLSDDLENKVSKGFVALI
jgi:hypothetical protein